MIRILTLCLVLASPLFAAEAGYRIVHPDGTVEFTDQPAKGAEEIRIESIPTYSAPAAGRTPQPSETNRNALPLEPEEPFTGYETFAIVAPNEQETVWFSEKGMNVSLQVQPPLAAAHHLIVRLDGARVASGSVTSFVVQNVYRGTHTLTAAIVDSQDAVIREATPVTFYLRQSSPLHPHSPLAPSPAPTP